MSVILETSLGDVTIDLLTEERPRCCLNFLKLCKMKYYNFALFHSVQRNLVAQTGDPTYTGKGGESVFYHLYGEQAKYFEAETKPRIKHRDRGVVSMVNNGKNQHGSQFFITLAKNLDYLDGVHTVFGEVAEGFEVLDKINEAYTDDMHRPYVDIRIYHTIILDDPFDDPSGLQIPDKSPEPTKEQLASVRIAPDEEIDDFKGKTNEEVEEMEKEKTAKKDAMLLEMVGDLPDQDVKPPDNVLFVCKLNPVTTEEDLEIIFSRFGEIASCEVIKDQKSGESLQYAFVEFESPDSCEKAYFKMDNVLIDDRRIHVDFSQSVSKYRWKGKGKGVEHIKSGGGDAKKDKRREASPVHRKSPKPRHTDHSPKSKHHDHSSKPRRNDPSPKSRLVERSPKHKKHKRVSRSRSKSPERKKNGRSRRHSSSPEEPRKRRSRSTEKKKGKKKAKEESRSRSRSVEKRKKRKDRSPSDSPPKKKKSKSRRSPSPVKKSKRRSSSPKKSKSKRRSPSPSPPARRRKRDSSSDSSDDDRKKRHGHKSR